MEFFRRAEGLPRRLGILAGTFNPPTRAHLALASAALSRVDEVLFVLPREFPHKHYEGAGFEARIAMLKAAAGDEPRFSIAATGKGLFIDIAHECREVYGGLTELFFLCGKDAAERIVNWDYGRPGAIREMLDEFQLLVAARKGAYEPPEDLNVRIHPLPLDRDLDEVSSTEVRERIAAGLPWEHLVPESIMNLVRRAFQPESDAAGYPI